MTVRVIIIIIIIITDADDSRGSKAFSGVCDSVILSLSVCVCPSVCLSAR